MRLLKLKLIMLRLLRLSKPVELEWQCDRHKPKVNYRTEGSTTVLGKKGRT